MLGSRLAADGQSCSDSREMHRYSHGFRGFFVAGHVVQIKTIFLQFFSCKSVKNWLSYAHSILRSISPKLMSQLSRVAKTGRCGTRSAYPWRLWHQFWAFKLEMSITQSILNRFAWKKLQKNCLNLYYMPSNEKPAKPMTIPMHFPKWWVESAWSLVGFQLDRHIEGLPRPLNFSFKFSFFFLEQAMSSVSTQILNVNWWNILQHCEPLLSLSYVYQCQGFDQSKPTVLGNGLQTWQGCSYFTSALIFFKKKIAPLPSTQDTCAIWLMSLPASF